MIEKLSPSYYQSKMFRHWSKIFPLTILSINFLYSLSISLDTLPNGLTMLSYFDNKLPMVELRVIVKAGSGSDPIGKEGLANLTTKMLLRGTKKRSAEAVFEYIEFFGSRIEEYVAPDFIQFRILTLTKYLDSIINIIGEILLAPAFLKEEFKKTKEEVIAEIKRDESQPDYLSFKEFYSNLYPSTHPYRHLIKGSVESVARIELADVLEFYLKHFSLENIFLILVGNFSKDKVKNQLEQIFTQGPKKEVKRWADKPLEPVRLPKSKVVILHRPEVSQAYILFGFCAISASSPDFLPVRVMNFVLGGGSLTSRLGKEVREKRGLAYDISSYFERRILPAPFICETQTEVKNTKEAIAIILDEVKKMREKGITNDELKKAKEFYTGNFPLAIDSYTDKASLIRDLWLFSWGLNYLERFPKAIKALSLATINEMAKKYLQPDNFLLVIVGNVKKEDVEIKGLEADIIEKF